MEEIEAALEMFDSEEEDTVQKAAVQRMIRRMLKSGRHGGSV